MPPPPFLDQWHEQGAGPGEDSRGVTTRQNALAVGPAADGCLGATQAVLVHDGVLYSGRHAHDCSSMGEYPDGARKHLLAESVDDPHLLSVVPRHQ